MVIILSTDNKFHRRVLVCQIMQSSPAWSVQKAPQNAMQNRLLHYLYHFKRKQQFHYNINLTGPVGIVTLDEPFNARSMGQEGLPSVDRPSLCATAPAKATRRVEPSVC